MWSCYWPRPVKLSTAFSCRALSGVQFQFRLPTIAGQSYQPLSHFGAIWRHFCKLLAFTSVHPLKFGNYFLTARTICVKLRQWFTEMKYKWTKLWTLHFMELNCSSSVWRNFTDFVHFGVSLTTRPCSGVRKFITWSHHMMNIRSGEIYTIDTLNLFVIFRRNRLHGHVSCVGCMKKTYIVFIACGFSTTRAATLFGSSSTLSTPSCWHS